MLGPSLVAWLGLAAAADVDDWLDAVVLVHQGSTTCAGVLVDAEGTVATAYHCVAPGGHPRATARDGSRATGRVVGVDVPNDLAVISVPGLAGQAWLSIAEGAPQTGDAVWALGHPLATDPPSGFFEGTLRWSSAAGHVSAVGTHALQLDAAVNPGNSGGPVVDARGHVVGIVSRRLGGEGLAYAGRSAALGALLQSEERGLGPLGGTLALEVVLATLDRPAGSVGVGGRAEVALRERVVLGAGASMPLSHRWSAARFGSSDAVRADGRLGLRQRFGRGAWAARLDGWGGVAWLDTLTADADDPLSLSTTSSAVPVVGGTFRLRSVGFEVGAVLDAGTPGTWTAVSLRWPGVVSVF